MATFLRVLQKRILLVTCELAINKSLMQREGGAPRHEREENGRWSAAGGPRPPGRGISRRPPNPGSGLVDGLVLDALGVGVLGLDEALRRRLARARLSG